MRYFPLQMKGAVKRSVVTIVLALCLLAAVAVAGNRPPVKPTARDKCPVCGMFVAKYPGFTAQVVYKDGTYAVFDGAKDLFKYLQNLRKYASGRQEAQFDGIHVTDYYSQKPVEATAARYVIGSDMLGPVGKEVIAFGKESDAVEFKKDHRGKNILRFREVTPVVIASLE